MGLQKFDGVAVKVGRAVYDKIKDFALLHNKSVQQVVNEGLDTWLDTWGAGLTEGKLERMAVSFSQHAEETFVVPMTAYPTKHPS